MTDSREEGDWARTIAGTGDDDLWVGGYRGSVHHWNGRRLVYRPVPYAESIVSVWSPQRGEAWAAAIWNATGTETMHRNAGMLVRWNGTRWVDVDAPGGPVTSAHRPRHWFHARRKRSHGSPSHQRRLCR